MKKIQLPKLSSLFIYPLALILCALSYNGYSQTTFSITGHVFNDVNGLTDQTVNGNGVDSGFIYVILVNNDDGTVLQSVANDAGGSFEFPTVEQGDYTVLISTTDGVVGALPPAVLLPQGWVVTGEVIGGTGTGDDGTADGQLTLGPTNQTIDLRFGVEQIPTVQSSLMGGQGNAGGVNFINFPAALFAGNDFDGGHIQNLRITSFPNNTTTLRVGTANFTAANFPTEGVIVPTSIFGNPTQQISIDPEDGVFKVFLNYKLVDNAGKESAETGIVTLPLVVADNFDAQQLADILTGEGVTVLNPTMNGTCPTTARGVFNFFGPNDLGIDSGIVLTSGKVVTAGGQIGVNGNVGQFASNTFPGAGPGDPDLNNLIAASGQSSTTNDACVLEFDFVPAGDTVKFDYVFGSEEYPEYACSNFNDVFGFFISGPGLPAGNNNIAIVPGTTIPVAINTINMGAGSFGSIGNCTNMGTGSPFSQYYINNEGMNGQQLTYDGYTTVLTAISQVNPCDTFHLKLAIADAGDHAYDSGVFLKAGSLSSTGIAVATFGGAGLESPFTNTVRGCPPGVVRISRTGNFNQLVTIPLEISGTAINGQDYETIPNSVTLNPGDTAVSIAIHGIPVFPPVGPKTVIISAISPFNCGPSQLVYDSDTITILDSIFVNILNPDTAICLGQSVDVQVESDTFLNFSWTPTNGVDFPDHQNVTLTPTEKTTYRVHVSLPNNLSAGCQPSSDSIVIDVKQTPQIDLGPNIFTCGDSVQLNAITTPDNPDESFVWSPANSLNDPTIRNPVAYLGTVGATWYSVTVNPGAIGCDGHDSVLVTILPDHIDLLNHDTVVCAGTIIHMEVMGDDRFSYNWAPSNYFDNDTIANATLVAMESGYYSVTASYPTCPAMEDGIYVEVQPVPTVNVGPDTAICDYEEVHLFADASPNYDHYQYTWSPASDMDNASRPDPIFSGSQSTTVKVKVTTPIGCSGEDSLIINVHPGNFLAVTPADTGFCFPDSIQLNAYNGETYRWYPSLGLNDINISNPVAHPTTPTNYTVVSKSVYGCLDSLDVFVDVYPNAVFELPDSVTIWPGEQYHIEPNGNTLYYSWFPTSGLSNPNIADPFASPAVRTRYFVMARTENGCEIKDSIDILVADESLIGLPNAFTPGGTANGTFRIQKRGLVKLKTFQIYNRWGNLVFETTDINQGWDGTYKGKPQPNGVYVYRVEAVTQTDQPFVKNGNVTLIR